MTISPLRLSLVVPAFAALLSACGSSDDAAPPVAVSTGGSGGAGAAASGGGGGGSPKGGAAGASAGKGGSAGSAGKAATAGNAGAAGKASGGAGGGSSTGGSAGAAGGNGGVGGASGGQGGAAPALEDVHVSGRTEKMGATHRFGWSGVSFATRFSGTGLSVVLEDGGSSNELEVIVDDAPHPERTITVKSGMQTYPVIDALPAGEHTAVVHRRTEGSVGTTTFHGFTVQGGAIVPSPSPYKHRIEIIGDSISCGYGTECMSANEAFSTKTENHWITYGAITARNLAADAHTIAWSGKGLVENYGTDTSAKMPELYPRTFATAAAPAWDFASWQAEVVVIDLGTNDWNHNPPVDPATFEAAYNSLADTIEGHYPGVRVFGVGNTFDAKAQVQAVKNAMSGKPNRHYIEFGILGSEGACCQHPCAVTHARWAKELTQAIQAATGW